MEVPRLGMTVAPADKVDGAGKNGVVVTNVDPKSAAADRGSKKGDVIFGRLPERAWQLPPTFAKRSKAARTDKKNSVLMRLRSGTRPVTSQCRSQTAKNADIGKRSSWQRCRSLFGQIFLLGLPPEGFGLDLLRQRL